MTPPDPALPHAGPGRDRAAVAVMGAATLVLQVVALRELLNVFWGSERVVGSQLGSWLVLGGAGSLLATTAPFLRRAARPAWQVLLLLLSVISPITVVLVRALPLSLGEGPGRMLGFGAGVAATMAALAPAGLLSGAAFATAIRVLAGPGEERDGPGRAGARAYAWDNAGGVAGGAAVTALLLGGESSSLALALAAGALLALAAWLVATRPRGPAGVAALALAAAQVAVALGPAGSRLDLATLAWAYPGEAIESRRETPVGQLVVTRRERQTNVWCSGRFVGSPSVVYGAEETAHLTLLDHPRPARVLVVGGVLRGLVGPVAMHGPDRLDLLEADRALGPVVEARLGWAAGQREGPAPAPQGARAAGAAPRLALSFGDARMFLRAATGVYDAVILPGGAPDTFAAHRLMTVECFEEVRRALAPGGLVAFTIAGTRSFQNTPLVRMLASIRTAMECVFKQVTVHSLEEAGFLFVGSDLPRATPDEARARWKARSLVARELVPGAFGLVHLGPADARLDRVLRADRLAVPDRDFEPVAVGYHDALVQVTSDGRESWASRLALSAGGLAWVPLVAIGLALGLAVALSLSAARRARVRGTAACVLAGFAGLALEVVWLDAFQVVRGNLYSEAGGLLAAFMAGACAGALAAAGPAGRAGRDAGLGLAGLALLAACGGLVPLLGRASPAGATLAIIAAMAATGALVGYTFGRALASGDPRGNGEDMDGGGLAGVAYAGDLAGAAAGGWLAAGLLVPVAGLPLTCGLVAAVLAAPAVCLARGFPAGDGMLSPDPSPTGRQL